MQRIVDDLLDLSRIESGGWTPKPATVDIESLAADVLSGMQRAAAARRASRCASTSSRSALAVDADPTALRQVLTNLVDNAVRHTTAGEVVVQARASNGGVAVSGPGHRRRHPRRAPGPDLRAVLPRRRRPVARRRRYRARPRDREAPRRGARRQGRTRASEPDRGTTIEAWFPHRRERNGQGLSPGSDSSDT